MVKNGIMNPANIIWEEKNGNSIRIINDYRP